MKSLSAVAAVVFAGLAGTTPAHAAGGPCTMSVGAVTSAGDFAATSVTASAPPKAQYFNVMHQFTPGVARLSTTWTWGPTPSGSARSAYVVLGSTLYLSTWLYTEDDDQESLSLDKVGSGWDRFTYVEQTWYGTVPNARSARYGLRDDGVLFRWTNGWRTVATAPGFASIKAMTLISETRTYDTFLATTRGGALYTIRIPATAPMKPVVKKVRTSTWQGFESLVAERCGTQSTLLTAIDKDSKTAYVYAVSHANGTATVIQGLGKVPAAFNDPVYSLYTTDNVAPLFGE